MSEWKEYRIEETSIEIIDGDRGKNYPKSNEFFAEGYCLFLNAGNVTKNGFSFSDNSFITREKDNVLRKGRLERSDVVITTRGTVGNIALYDINVPFEHIRINSGMLILKSGKDILPEYLYYYLKGNRFQTQIRQYVSGTAQPQLPKSTLEKMSISYPRDKSIQEKIIAILKFFENRIAVNRRICENLEAQAQALFKHWFIDFAPFKNGKFVESELGMIPEGWRVGTLGEICKTNKRTLSSKNTPDVIEYLDTGNITANKIDNIQVLHKGQDKIPSRAKRLVSEGDILFSAVRPNQRHYGLLMNPSPSLVVSTGFVVITANWSAYRYFIYRFLIQNSIIETLQAIGEQSVSTYPSINANDIESLKLIIPKMEDVEDFADICCTFYCKIESIEQESSRLSTLRDTLLPKLMSGQIKV